MTSSYNVNLPESAAPNCSQFCLLCPQMIQSNQEHTSQHWHTCIAYSVKATNHTANYAKYLPNLQIKLDYHYFYATVLVTTEIQFTSCIYKL